MQYGDACREDPTKRIGDSWLCDDGCNTCTCNPDGHVEAYGCVPEGPKPSGGEQMEQTLVAIAATAVIACLVCFAVLCCVMCRTKGDHGLVKASELEGADEEDD